MDDTTQVKVTIPVKTKNLLKEKADSLGMNFSAYVKLLLQVDIKDFAYPEYEIKPELEKKIQKTIELSNKGILKSFNTTEELDAMLED